MENRIEDRSPRIKAFVPLANLDELVLGGWVVNADNVFEAAMKAKVLQPMMLNAVKPKLESIKPMKAVSGRGFVANLGDTHVKKTQRPNWPGEQICWVTRNGCLFILKARKPYRVAIRTRYFKQIIKLHNTLRQLMGEDLIVHLRLDHYQDLAETL